MLESDPTQRDVNYANSYIFEPDDFPKKMWKGKVE